MADVKWIKINVRIFDDHKIRRLRRLPEGDRMVLLWLMLECLAGRCNDGGRLWFMEGEPYTAADLAEDLEMEPELVERSLQAFVRLRLIVVEDGVMRIADWEDEQNLEVMERIREQDRQRKKRKRESEKEVDEEHMSSNVSQDKNGNVQEVSADKNRNVQEMSADKNRNFPDTDRNIPECPALDKDKEEEKDKEIESDHILSHHPFPERQAAPAMGSDGMDARRRTKDAVMQGLGFDGLVSQEGLDRRRVMELVELITDVLCSTKRSFRVNSEDIPADVVKERFLSLTGGHVRYVLETMDAGSERIRNMKAYLLTSLFNAPLTCQASQAAQLSHAPPAEPEQPPVSERDRVQYKLELQRLRLDMYAGQLESGSASRPELLRDIEDAEAEIRRLEARLAELDRSA